LDIGFLEEVEVDPTKIEDVEKLPYPRDIKGIRSFLGHAVFLS
jgi:hypothetical protein